MLTVDEAREAVLGRAEPLPARSVGLRDSLGLILAEPIVADLDLPPFDKALMDGYAVRSVDLRAHGACRLRVVGEVTAGRTPDRPLAEGEAVRIMTGAPLPSGSDSVVMVERTQFFEDQTVQIAGPIAPGLNWLPRGREMKAGDVLLEPGTEIDATKLGLIASAGRVEVRAIPRPTVRVVPTGDELVDAGEKPGAGQIRNSNGPMLAGLAASWGAVDVSEMPIAPDDPAKLRAILEKAISASDVVLISGGVSAGTKDLVPGALVDLGIEPVFHKVRVKPGKPLWFGVGPRRGHRPGVLVFGLPGNPASGVVGFLLFVRPALDALAGRPATRSPLASFPLGVPFEHRGDRPTYHPARVREGRLVPLSWAGSADLRTVALADGFAAFPPGDRAYREGERVGFLPSRRGRE